LVALAAHAAKPFHSFSRLVWMADLAMIVSDPCAPRPIEWAVVRSRAQAVGATTVMAVALAQARRAGALVPSELFPVPGPGWQGAALAPLLDSRWPLDGRKGSSFHLRFALVDGARPRLGLLIGSAHGKGPVESLLWPFRLTWQALRRLWRLKHHPWDGIR
ncbi:MAG: hypothetical protein ACRD0I_11180, partial [Acidimicrobiales bacterium]